MGFSRQEYWSGLPFPSPGDHTLSDLSTMTVRLGWPHTAWLSFTELDATVVLWSDWLVFCDYDFSLSALWCPLATPPVLLGFLLSWTWGISPRLLQQSAAAAPYLGRAVSPHGRPPDLERGVAPLGPPAPTQPPLLGGELAPLGRCPWLQTRASSSQQPPVTLDMG